MLAATAVHAFGGSAAAAPSCDAYASTGGSDSASGTATAPFRTAQRLVDSLDSGQTGCLQPGETFAEDFLRIRSSNVTLTTAPGGERATIAADVRIEGEPALINNVELSGLNIVGEGPPDGRPLIRVVANDVRLLGNFISNPGRTTCLDIAPVPSIGIRIEGNVVRDCGPASSNSESGIGVEFGRDVVIADNYILSNPARGVQLFPEALNTYIHNNVIDGNGDNIQFAGDASHASVGNLVAENLVSNARGFNVTYFWGGPEGRENLVSRNCLDGANGNVNTPTRGFTVAPDNTFADPRYRNRAEGPSGLGPVPSSPCVGKGPQPAAFTGSEATLTADPNAASVITASVPGEVNARWQPTTYRVEYGTTAGALDQRTGELDAGSGSVPVPRTSLLTGLLPATRYGYRLVATHPSGVEVAGAEHAFTTPPAPLLRPLTSVAAGSVPGKNGPRVNLRVMNAPLGSDIVVRCAGGRKRRCPSTQTLTARSRNQAIPKYKRLLRLGARVQVIVTKPGTMGRRFTLEVVQIDKRGFDSLRQTDQTCLQPDTNEEVDCLDIQLPFSGNRFRRVKVLNAPLGSVVTIRCLGGRANKCPVGITRRTVRSPGTDFRFKTYERRKYGRRAVVEVFVTKPNTIGAVTRVRFVRQGRFLVARPEEICIESEGNRPTTCPPR